MNTVQFKTYDAMCLQTAEEIVSGLAANPEQMLCIAAGHTSLGVFTYLINAFHNGRADFSRAWFVAMDEWLHMDAHTPESCGSFLVEHFLSKVNYPKDHIRLWNGKAPDPQAECRSVEKFISANATDGVIDYLVLGAGMNGHLALNEPGTPMDSRAHVSHLDALTAQVGQKYFSNGAALTGGITLGIGNFSEAKRTLLLINGEKKADILADILKSCGPDTALPATALYEFGNASIYYDAAASSNTSIKA